MKNNIKFFIKEIIDIVISFIILLLFLPIMMIICILIKIDSPGPILFKQKRVGKNLQKFEIFKFRTMTHSIINTNESVMHLNEASGPVFKIKNDPRLTKIGKFLRKTSIDEIPQIFNVLKGDMSFVGPRAILYNHNDIIEMRTKNDVHKLIPGITGWAQINGRDDISAFDKVMLDTEYLKKRSMWFDLKILWITFFKVLRRLHGHQTRRENVPISLECRKKLNEIEGN